MTIIWSPAHQPKRIEDWWPCGGTSLKMEYESTSSLHSFFPYPPTRTCGELYNFGGVSHADMSMVMETIQPFFSTPGHPTASTGYLQDALIEWNKFSKRRRLSFDNNDGSSSSENIMEDFDCLREIMDTSRVPDDGLQTSLSSNSRDRKLAEEAISSSETTNSSSSCDMDDLFKIGDTLLASEPPSSPEGDDIQGRRKKFGNGVVYPFAVVKPGGFDGDVTLNDINKRMHMPPTRPVKHPVGDFACRPCISPNGPGISGKFVVSFTKIQTRGSGTITIVRTRG